MSKIKKMQRYWGSWEPVLKQIVQLKGAKLMFPTQLSTEDHGETVEMSPTLPIFIWNAPDKASSSKKGTQAILIDGHFEVNKGDADPFLQHSGCNITIFRSVEKLRESLALELIDAIHFDVEFPPGEEGCRLFHPIFHAQRGTSNDVTDQICKKLASDAFKLDPARITVDQSKKEVLGTPYLRLPTPQLDLFSVMTMVAADFFCSSGELGVGSRKGRKERSKAGPAATVNANVKDRFVKVLDLLRDKDNVVSAGVSSHALRTRLTNAGHLSAGWWYPECV